LRGRRGDSGPISRYGRKLETSRATRLNRASRAWWGSRNPAWPVVQESLLERLGRVSNATSGVFLDMARAFLISALITRWTAQV
jgi:hypothetical protein